MEDPREKYIEEHSKCESEALHWLVKQTNIQTNYPRMLSGKIQGSFMTLLVQLMNAKSILEIGTFTGYSTICLAYGLPEDGHIDTLELNDELEDLILEGFTRAKVNDKITLHIGDAKETLTKLKSKQYDLAFIDANKREYPEYYEEVIEMIRPGGCILIDDTLWDGKPYQKEIPQDKQTQGICKLNDMVANDPRVDVVMLPLRHGLSLIRKKY